LIDELSRHKLFTKLEDILGTEDAAVLIEHLPPVGWGDIATKQDLRSEISALRSDSGNLKGEVGTLRGEIGNLRGEIGTLRAEFVALRSEISAQFRTTLFTMMGLMVTLAGLAFMAARLG